MATKPQMENNKKRIRMAKQQAAKRAALKAVAENMALPPEERFAARLKLAALPRNGSKTRVRNRCELTGRSRANYRKFGLSRVMLRELGNWGQIVGLVKSSW